MQNITGGGKKTTEILTFREVLAGKYMPCVGYLVEKQNLQYK